MHYHIPDEYGPFVDGERPLDGCKIDLGAERRMAFDKAIGLGLKGEDEALALIMKGSSLGSLGRHEEAVKAFDKAINLDVSIPSKER